MEKSPSLSPPPVKKLLAIGIAAAVLSAFACTAQAQVVAVGASNTAGYHAGGQGWTDQLQSMMRARGYSGSFSVMAVVGDTSAGIASRAKSIPGGTKVVIFDVGKGNDADAGAGGGTGANQASIAAIARSKGAKAIFVPYARIVGNEKANPSAWRPNDPHHHLTVASHTKVAAWLLPQVMAAVGKR